jgi:hypothetical protein
MLIYPFAKRRYIQIKKKMLKNPVHAWFLPKKSYPPNPDSTA